MTYTTLPVKTPADAAANGVCRGKTTLDLFAPEMGVTQAELDAYAKRYADEKKTCDEMTYLGSVDYGDGSVDYIFRMNIAGKHLWYIFTIEDGLVTNIQ